MYKKVLLTIDGSELARSAIPHARTLLEGSDAEVVILEVVRPLETLRADAYGMYEFTHGDLDAADQLAEQLRVTEQQRAELDVETARAALQASGLYAVRTEVATGLAGNAIIDCAERERVDAILMATRGHGGLGREVMGSVAEYVLRHAGEIAVILVGSRSPAAR